MTFYKNIDGNYITAISTGSGNEEITQDEYNTILNVIRSRPITPDGKGYRLTTALEWEEYDLPAVDADPELSEAEALRILLGGADA